MIKNAKIVGAGIDPQVYHRVDEKRGDEKHPVSPSMLKNFAQCPSRWIAGYHSPDSDAKQYGSLLDVLVLTPEQFDSKYAVKPATYKDAKTGEEKPWNGNALVCKAWLEDHAEFEIVSPSALADAKAARDRLLTFEPDADFPIKRFIEASDRQVLVVAEWHDEATGLVIPLRCLIDLAPRKDTEFSKCLGDLKSTRCAAIIPFQRDAYKMRYHVQAAFDMDLHVAATGEDRNTWCLVVQESFEPWQPGKRIMSDMPETPGNFIALGRATYRKWLKNYCACLASGQWPAYDDNDEAAQGWTPIAAEPFMESDSLFAPSFEFNQADPPTTEEPHDDIWH